MQRYGELWLIPRNRADSSSTCCDGVMDLRHSKLIYVFCVAKNHKTSILVTKVSLNILSIIKKIWKFGEIFLSLHSLAIWVINSIGYEESILIDDIVVHNS